MYTFLSDIQLSEIERLHERNQKLKQGLPVGVIFEKGGGKKKQKKKKPVDSSDEEEQMIAPLAYQYEDNFPELPDHDGKGKQIRKQNELRKKMQANQSLN